uniref:Uncharacterized protein n=1 Tax=Lotharella globosa TaxID=91324 RepID=A0A7S3YR07_9EUKA
MIAKLSKFLIVAAIAHSRAQRQSYRVRIDNLSFRQPLGGIFVSTHDNRTPPLFTFNQPASPELAVLAEDGNPQPLVDLFKRQHGVSQAFSVPGPIAPGASTNFTLKMFNDEYLSLGTMAINTNDCFVALNGERVSVSKGSKRLSNEYYLAGLDAGSEVNNELCGFIPGPACAPMSGNKRATKGAEGFVHVHRGFFGINEGSDAAFNIDKNDVSARGAPLTQARYDWRNLMALVTVSKCEVKAQGEHGIKRSNRNTYGKNIHLSTSRRFDAKVYLYNDGDYADGDVDVYFYASRDQKFGPLDRQEGFLGKYENRYLEPYATGEYEYKNIHASWGHGKRYIIAAWKSACDQTEYSWVVVGEVDIRQ